jgi:DNA ligase 1
VIFFKIKRPLKAQTTLFFLTQLGASKMLSPTSIAMRAATMITSPPRSAIYFAAKSTSLTKPSKSIVKEFGNDFSGDVGRALVYDSPQRRIRNVARGLMSVADPLLQGRSKSQDAPRPKRWSLVALAALKKNRPSLAEFHPGIAGGWITSSHRLANVDSEPPSSQRNVWWRCAHCDATFQRKVVKHVECGGECPACHEVPAVDQRYAPLPPLRFRKLTNRKGLWSQHSARVRKSIADLQRPESTKKLRVPPLHRRNLQPMLAHLWQKYRHIIAPGEQLTVSPKLDGVRCIAAWEPSSKRVVLLSRHGTIIESCPHVNAALKTYFIEDPSLVLDGELYHHTAFESFEELSGLVRRTNVSGGGLSTLTKSEAAKLQAMEFHIFDVMEGKLPKKRADAVNVGELPFTARLCYLQAMLGASSNTFSRFEEHQVGGVKVRQPPPKCIKIVPAISCDIEHVDRYLKSFTDKGYEGVMVRRVAEPYAKGKRSSHLLKYKTMLDDEYRIHGVVEGQGKWKHAIAAFTCRTKSGKTFHASPAVTDVRRRSLWTERSRLIGKMLTVQYQEMTDRGVPRFPVGKAVRGSFKNKSDWL